METPAEKYDLDPAAYDLARTAHISAPSGYPHRESDRLAIAIKTYLDNAVIVMDGGGP